MDSSVLKELKFLIFRSLSGKVFPNWLALNLVDLVDLVDLDLGDKCY